MKNPENTKRNINRIYDRESKTWFEVTAEQCDEFNKWRESIRQRAQYHHLCNCPKEKWWECDGICTDCEYSVSHNEL